MPVGDGCNSLVQSACFILKKLLAEPRCRKKKHCHNYKKQEDHDGPLSLSSQGRQSYVPTCDPRGRATFDPRASNEQTW